MKVIQKQSTSSATVQRKSGQPFFQKQGEEATVNTEREAFFSSGQRSGNDPQSDTLFFQKPARPFVQTKLTVGQPGDPYEQEADAMADKVVQRLAQPDAAAQQPLTAHKISPLAQLKSNLNQTNHSTASTHSNTPSPIQLKCDSCEKEEKKETEEGEVLPMLQRKPIFESNDDGALQMKCAACEQEEKTLQPKSASDAGSGGVDMGQIESSLSSSKGGGSALPDDTRLQMEGAFGADFSGVRVHTGGAAVQMNQDLQAQAFTHGSDVYFNAGKYDTGSTEGKRLLGHELTHVVQQGGGALQAKYIQRQDAGGGGSDADLEEDTDLEEADGEGTGTESIGENSVPDGTPVQETHPSDCVQLVPPYPSTEGQAEVTDSEDSLYEDLLSIAGTGLLGGVAGVIGRMAARLVWHMLPDEAKITVINRALDIAIQGSQVQRMIGSLLPGPGGFMQSILSSVMVGFFRSIRNLPDGQKMWMFNRHMRMILGVDSAFTINFLKGIVIGFFLDGIVGIVQMVIDIVCFIPKIVNFFSSLTNFITNIPEELRALTESINGLMLEIGNFIINGSQEVYEIITNPGRVVELLQSISNSANIAAESIGERVAQSMVRFLSLPSATLGEITGRITGQLIFEVVLAALTSGGGAGLTVAKTALRAVGKMLMRIGRFIFKLIRYIGRILRFVAEGLRSIARFLTRIMRMVVARVGVVIERIMEIFRLFRRLCRPGSVFCPNFNLPRLIAGTQGLRHSFDRHAAEWFGRAVRHADLAHWQSLLERARQSSQVFAYQTGADHTIAHLARIEGKYFLVQFFAEGPRAGEVATAFVPNPRQLSRIFRLLR